MFKERARFEVTVRCSTVRMSVISCTLSSSLVTFSVAFLILLIFGGSNAVFIYRSSTAECAPL
jgi:hypothetical protein